MKDYCAEVFVYRIGTYNSALNKASRYMSGVEKSFKSADGYKLSISGARSSSLAGSKEFCIHFNITITADSQKKAEQIYSDLNLEGVTKLEEFTQKS